MKYKGVAFAFAFNDALTDNEIKNLISEYNLFMSGAPYNHIRFTPEEEIYYGEGLKAVDVEVEFEIEPHYDDCFSCLKFVAKVKDDKVFNVPEFLVRMENEHSMILNEYFQLLKWTHRAIGCIDSDKMDVSLIASPFDVVSQWYTNK